MVVIDVRTTAMQSYRGSHRREITNAQKAGVTASVDAECSLLSDFIEIYRQTMQGLQASEYYYFNDAYFNLLKNSEEFKASIIFAEIDGKKIAAAMFIVTGNIMQYYLSGTLAEFRKLAPSKLIIARAHELAAEMGLDWLVLGGGVGSTQDALFKFKSGFSSVTKPFYITKKILNAEVFHQLCADRSISPDQTGFFPAYRA